VIFFLHPHISQDLQRDIKKKDTVLPRSLAMSKDSRWIITDKYIINKMQELEFKVQSMLKLWHFIQCISKLKKAF